MNTYQNAKSYEFINPYNFIPLSAKRVKRDSGQGTYTGVINYSVLTKTPLFIPNTSNDDALQIHVDGHKSYEFFSYTDLAESKERITEPQYMPVIPGSEMRGMLRSNFEILTNSCMSAIEDDMTLSKRTVHVYNAGLLKKTGRDTYDLYKAKDCLMRTLSSDCLTDDWADDEEHYIRKCYIQKELKEGQKIYFNYVERKIGNGAEIKPLAKNVSPLRQSAQDRAGYVMKGEKGPETGTKQQKHCCHIFTLTSSNSENVQKNISLSTLRSVLKEYRDHGENTYDEYTKSLEAFESGPIGDYFPVYYSEAVPGYLMLSPACITREIHRRKITDMIPDHKSCADQDKLCPACALFGALGKKVVSVSRVRVADLVCQEKKAQDCYEQPVTLPPLSSPKLSNMEFYFKRPQNAWFWTYDYYIDNKGKIQANHEGINGRKFYWHQPDMKLMNQDPSNQNMTIRPLKSNIIFDGKLYFRNLTKTELDQLIYLMNAGDESEIEKKKHGYKLGGGKPLGLGSIAISVNSVMLRSYERDTENHTLQRNELPYEQYSEPEFNPQILDSFEKMTNFDTVKGKNVSYPLTGIPDQEGKMNVFDWFTQNHMGYKNKDGINERLKMPNNRKQMVYAEYMEPMVPELLSTGFLENSVESRKKQDRGKTKPDNKKVVEAIVTGIDRSGCVYIMEKEDQTRKGRIGADYLKGKTFKRGDTVKVSYYKTNKSGIRVYNIE